MPGHLGHPCVILNADADSTRRDTKNRILTNAGYRVLQADTGMRAIGMAREIVPSVAILDFNLPDVSGAELCRRIKSDPSLSHIAILQTCASVSPQQRTMSLAHEADGFITGSIDPDELLITVRSLLELSRKEEDNRRLAQRVSEETAERGRLLLRTAEQLLTGEDPAEMMTAVFETVRRHLSLDGFFHYRIDERRSGLVLEACAGVPDDMMPAFRRLEFGQALCGTSAQLGGPVIRERLHESDDDTAQAVKQLGFRAYVCHPLMVGERLLGTLSFASAARDRFEPDEIECMRTICRYVAAASDRLHTQVALRRANEGLTLAQQASHSGIWDWDMTSGDIYVSPEYRSLYGISPDQPVTYDYWLSLVHADDRPAIERAGRALFEAGRDYHVEFRIEHPTRGRRWLAGMGTLTRDDEGRPRRFSGINVDMTDCKRAEERFGAVGDTVRHLVEHSPFGVFAVDADFRLVQVSAGAQKVFETIRPLIGRDFAEILRIIWPEPFASEAIARFRHTLHTGEPYRAQGTVERRHDIGEIESYDWQIQRVTLADGRYGVVCHFYDLSERQRYEAALCESEERLRLAVEGAAMGTWDADVRTGRSVWNRQNYLLMGYDPDSGPATVEMWRARLHPDDAAEATAAFEEARDTKGIYRREHRILRADTGEERWLQPYGRFLFDQHGEPIRSIGVLFDVTERKRAQERLSANEAQLRAIYDGTEEYIGLLAPDGTLLRANRASLQFGPSSPADVIGRPFWDTVWFQYTPGAADMVKRGVSQAAAGEFVRREVALIRPSGEVRTFDFSLHPICDANGRVILIVPESRDVTERKLAEDALRESEERFKTLAEAMPHLIWQTDAHGEAEYENERWHAYTGLDHASTRADGWLTAVHPEDVSRMERAWRLAMDTGTEYDMETRFRHVGDGAYRWFRVQGAPIKDVDGRVVRWVGTGTDIQEIKEATQALRERERFVQRIIDTAPATIYIYNILTDRTIYTNPGTTASLGYTEADMREMNERLLSLVMHPDDRSRVREHFTKLAGLRDGDILECEYRMRTKDGAWRWFLSRDTVYRRTDQGVVEDILGTATDITDRKTSEELLRASEAQLRLVSDHAPVYIAHCDTDMRYKFVNVPYAERLGLSPDACVGKRIPEIVGEAAFQTLRSYIETALAGNDVECDVEVPYDLIGRRWMHCTYVPEWGPAGDVRGMVAVVTDITARREADAALRQREEQLRVITDAVPSLISYVDRDQRYQFVNAGYERMFGRRREDIVGRSIQELLGASYVTVQPYVLRALAGERVVFETLADYAGRQVTVLASYTPDMKPDGSVAGFYALITDISDRKRFENELRRSADELERRVSERTKELTLSQDRLRALASQLTIAEQQERRRLAEELHDYLAQLLVLVRLKLAQARTSDTVASTKAFVSEADGVMEQALGYTRTLVADLAPPVLREFGLVAALHWLVEQMKRHELSMRVRAVHEVQLAEEQALLVFQSIRELLINTAKHACCTEALVSVEIGDERLVVVVQDDGRGFDPATLSGQQENGDASSHGFGLFSIRERMSALGGTFDIESSPGHGTRATLVLPLAPYIDSRTSRTPDESLERPAADPLPIHPRETADPPSHRHATKPIRVLLVDDHADVRQGLRGILEMYPDIQIIGEAADGEAAVALAGQIRPDVILIDVNMPGMDGIEATKQLRQSLPSSAVIGLSLDPSRHVERAIREAGAAAFHTKEAAIAELYHTIRKTRA